MDSKTRMAVYRLLNVLGGFATNATACGACQMSNNSATRALERFERDTGISPDEAYRATHPLIDYSYDMPGK